MEVTCAPGAMVTFSIPAMVAWRYASAVCGTVETGIGIVEERGGEEFITEEGKEDVGDSINVEEKETAGGPCNCVEEEVSMRGTLGLKFGCEVALLSGMEAAAKIVFFSFDENASWGGSPDGGEANDGD